MTKIAREAMINFGIMLGRSTMIAASKFEENIYSNRASAESLAENCNYKIAKRINNA